MNASSESGLWASWVVRGIDRSAPSGGLLAELVQHRLVIEVLGLPLLALRVVVRQEIPIRPLLRGAVALELRDGAADHEAQEVIRVLLQDRVGERLRGG